MAKSKNVKPERIGVTLTPKQTERFNNYIINVGKKQGRIPGGIKTKLIRVALEEWFDEHENNLDIDWSKQD